MDAKEMELVQMFVDTGKVTSFKEGSRAFYNKLSNDLLLSEKTKGRILKLFGEFQRENINYVKQD